MEKKKATASQATKTQKVTASQATKKVVAPQAKKGSVTPQVDNLLDRVIHNISEDQEALKEQNELIDKAKSYKREIVDRIRDSRRDLVTFVKYATPEQLEKLKSLDIDLESLGNGLNKVAQLALEIIGKTTKGEMTNKALYDAYVATFKHPEDAYNYTEFNIKCRSLFNSQRLLRKEPAGAKSSHEHIISLNGFKPNK